MLSELPFGSWLSYTPRGDSKDCRDSRNLTYNLKEDRAFGSPPQPLSTLLAGHLRESLAQMPFAAWLGPGVTLVPVPKSSLMQPGTLWVPQRLAGAMVAVGLGRESLALLRRTSAVAKAAFSGASSRPRAADHDATLAVDKDLYAPTEIVVVDDVITTGAAMIAAASRLSEAFPGVPIRGIAFVRTVSSPEDFAGIQAPCVGTITLYPSGRTHREP